MRSDVYRLDDARVRAAESRYTFFIPSESETAAVRVGDSVRLTFEWLTDVEKYGGERMWVEITRIDGETLTGTLDNEPFEKGKLQRGDVIAFERRHILDIQWIAPKPPAFPRQYREYWERCLVDDCVLDGSEPVEYLYREEPDMAEESDKYPDSGWRIRGRIGSATDDEIEARKPQYVALGAVLNRDDSWLHLIDSPIGSAYERDFETGEYRAVDN